MCEQFADGTTAVVRENVFRDRQWQFGDNNNWKESQWRKYLNTEYLKEIENDFGADKIVEHDVNLTSLDGYDDYRTAIDGISAMDIDMYRKYHKYIGNTGVAHYLSYAGFYAFRLWLFPRSVRQRLWLRGLQRLRLGRACAPVFYPKI